MFTLTVSSHYIHANRQLVSPPAEPRRALWLLPRISKPFELIVFHLLVTSWLFAWGFNVALRKKHNDLMFREKTLILKICVRSAQTYCWTRAERSAGVHRKRKKKGSQGSVCELTAHPSKRLQDSTQVRPRLKYRQERHWSGPGPQHPSSEHIRSHTIRSWSVERTEVNKWI